MAVVAHYSLTSGGSEEQKPFCYSFHFSYSLGVPVTAAALCVVLLLAACLFQKAFILLSFSGCLIPPTFYQQVFCFFVFVKVLGALSPPLPPSAVPTGLSLAHTAPGEQESIHPPSPASPQPLCPQHLQLSGPWESSSCSAFHPRNSTGWDLPW